MVNVLNDILSEIRNIESMMVLIAIIATPFALYMAFDHFCKKMADKFFLYLEKRKDQKEYDEMITRHEERYFK